jgi:uncharacterized membrane protein
MDPALTALIAASVTFVGSHFLMSHPLRAPLVRALGDKGFLGLYSLVSLAAFAWMIVAFRAVSQGGEPLWSGYDEVSWTIASALTLVAMVLLLGSLKGNPALPDAPAALAAQEPSGVFRVTRHPMMWGFALWAIAHILIMPTPRTLVLAGSLLVLALLGSHLQDRKKEALMGAAWKGWEAKTSFWPRWFQLAGAGWGLWIGAAAVWLVLTWAHVWVGYVPAGIWRWVG